MKPLFVVRVLTYNQEKYIRQCLDSILMQVVNFSYKIIIGEDCSTDNTAIICKEYQEKYPEIIKLLCNETNNIVINSSKNWQECITSGAKYIALLEGDDYWTDSYKLQKQVDFLETNPDYVMCFHPIKILDLDGSLNKDYITNLPENYELIETLALKGNYIHTPSVVFRNILKEIPKEMLESPVGDYFLYILLAKHGKIKQIPDCMAVYRKGAGIWSSLDRKISITRWIIVLDLLLKVDFTDKVLLNLKIQRKEYVYELMNLNKSLKWFQFKNELQIYNLNKFILFKKWIYLKFILIIFNNLKSKMVRFKNIN